MQRWLDNAFAIVGSVLLHALIVAGLLVNLQWTSAPTERPQTTIQAALVSADTVDSAAEVTLPEPEPITPPPVVPEPEEDPGPTPEELEAARLAEEAAAEEARQLQLERERAEEAQRQQQRDAEEAAAQAEAEAAERRAREKAEREAREREARERAERERQEKERQERERREKERQERERAEREARARQEALEEELRAAMAAEEARQGAVDAGLLAQYIEQIRQDVERQWNRPGGVAVGIRCSVAVRQLRNGEVISVRVDECAGGDLLVRSIEAAVFKASPLPTPRDPSLFERNIRFEFVTSE